MSQEEASSAAGIPIDTYRKYEADSRSPGSEALAGMALLGIDLTWLLTGTGSDAVGTMRPHGVRLAQQMHAKYQATDAFALVPLYDVRAAAGHGALADDREPPEHWAFSRAWIARSLGVPASRLILVTLAGDSMTPDLHDGDVVMVDRGDVEVLREGVYVFYLEGHIYVKRLQLLNDQLSIISSNGDFPQRKVSAVQENSTFRLIGRVIGKPTFQRF